MATPQEIKQAQAILKQNREAGTPISIRDAITQVKTPTPTGAGAMVTPSVPTPTVPNPLPTVNALGGTVENRQNTRNVVTGKGATVTPSGALLDAN